MAAQTNQQSHILGWIVALLLLGGVANAYMRNAYHRVPGFRARSSGRTRARLEFAGSLFLLLPTCWALAEMGWNHTDQMRSLSNIAASASGQGGITLSLVPTWLLYAALPAAAFLLACSALSVMLRSLVYLHGPSYLLKRAGTHLDLEPRDHHPTGEHDAI